MASERDKNMRDPFAVVFQHYFYITRIKGSLASPLETLINVGLGESL